MQNNSQFNNFSGIIVAISTFTGGARGGGTGPSGGDYFIGFVIILIAIGWVTAAVADFFMLTKVNFPNILLLYCTDIPIKGLWNESASKLNGTLETSKQLLCL